jgi:glycosyltransferase involved in cell wall biosynthesis
VHEVLVPGSWPPAAGAAERALAAALAAVPAGMPVLVDGLLGSAAPRALAAAADRGPVTVVVHLPLGVGGGPDVAAAERAALLAASAVVATSPWTRHYLLERYGLDPHRVTVATPGAAPGPIATGTPTGTSLVCVGTPTPHKGHDVLAAALAAIADLDWRCTLVGDLHRDPGFVADLRAVLARDGLAGRVHLTGALPPAGVAAAYDAADLLVLPSRVETYGMVLTEALARGVPVVATRTGGVADTVGRALDGRVPGLLVPPSDPEALAAALRRWCTDGPLRAGLRRAAVSRRATLVRWEVTTAAVAAVLTSTLVVPV